ncbi:miniconductance mechanosensitive channel MscM [Enterobacter sp.]|uniref:miniconductance mechanosensitive channel MscM n=1 Tax=Enterobacter sp. TaxID=42895 RepID=UPI00296F371A|nr:miniconductance mechanosensitive channel MscM [Enterobacter sp.]
MRLIIAFLMAWCLSLSMGASAATAPDAKQIAQELEQAKGAKNAPDQAETVEVLQAALNALDERNGSLERAKQYQQVIDDFAKTSQTLRAQLNSMRDEPRAIPTDLSSDALNQEILQVSSQLLAKTRLAQQEQERAREISDSLSQLPQQQTDARRQLNEVERRAGTPAGTTALAQAQLLSAQAESARLKALVDELELAQLSANNRQELARMRSELAQKQAAQLDTYLQALRNQLNSQRQREAEQALESTEMLAENSANLPVGIVDQFKINRELSQALNQQAQRMDLVASQQRQATGQTLQVRQALNTLREQSQWLGASNMLGEALRAQVARLPEMPKPQQLDTEMAQLRVHRMRYEDLLNKQPQLRQIRQVDGQPLTREQSRILDAQLRTQRELLTSLLQGGDTLILELTKLKVSHTQLEDALKEVNEATHRYLFWTSDVSPINLSWPIDIVQDLRRLISLDTFSQLGKATLMMLTTKETLLPLFAALFLVGFSLYSRKHFTRFLERSSARVGKVTQDHFWLTLRTVFWSILVASPLPVLWATLGYGLREAWPYPLAVAIGDGVTATVPMLWAVMICATFARPNGLFVAHFAWPRARVARGMRNYLLCIGLIVPLIMALIMFDNLNDREFSGSLGRLCFMLICGALAMVTLSLKRAGIPLYVDKTGSSDNMGNHLLWNLLLSAPLVAMLAAMVGYLATAQALLARLETSVAIWFLLLVVYHIIRRWMLIQRRRLAFDRAKHRRAEILAQRARGEEDPHHTTSTEGLVEVDESEVDLDTISTQSLRLVRSILMLIALLSVIVLWSEIHSAFGFLENISLWDVTSTVQGVESLEPITLGAVLIAILVFIITTQLVRNLPALLELALLQHLDLTPGTGYAITTITKYLLMLFGGLVGFSMIGIEWSKLQWLVAALGVGLGFGLQEIFANFISGLIILFEKPIRIGDTVTIRDLTGSITKINTRATTISDWDRKEIIVPNKAFITEQFINWSLSDSVTRVVLTVPAPADANSEEVTQLLYTAAERCSLVIDNPPPEVFLVDLQQGIQLFELRIYAAEMGHRMPLRHEIHQLILAGFREHGIDMPFPPFQMRLETLGGKATNRTLTSAGRGRPAGSL